MEGILAIIGVFFLPAAIIGLVLYFRHRAHLASLSLAGDMIERGQTIEPELIRSLGIRRRPRHADLRTGLIWLAVGTALLVIGLAVPGDDGTHLHAVFSVLPILIGAVFVGLWRFVSRHDES